MDITKCSNCFEEIPVGEADRIEGRYYCRGCSHEVITRQVRGQVDQELRARERERETSAGNREEYAPIGRLLASIGVGFVAFVLTFSSTLAWTTTLVNGTSGLWISYGIAGLFVGVVSVLYVRPRTPLMAMLCGMFGSLLSVMAVASLGFMGRSMPGIFNRNFNAPPPNEGSIAFVYALVVVGAAGLGGWLTLWDKGKR